MWADRNWDQVKQRDSNQKREFLAHSQNIKLGEGPKKANPITTFLRLFLPSAGSASEDMGHCLGSSRQSPGHMSPHTSTQPLSCWRARDTSPAPTFCLYHLQCADWPTSSCWGLSAASSQWPSLPAEKRTPGRIIMPRWNKLLKEAIVLQDKTLGVGKLFPFQYYFL